MSKAKVFKSSFNAGELSPRIDARPDLAKYPSGAKTLENYLVFPTGGVYGRYGTRKEGEVKDNNAKTRLLPFIFSRTDSIVIEFGHMYIRFHKNGARIESPPGTPVEVATPYTTSELFDIHWTQSADVMYLDHASHAPMKLSRASDTNWTLSALPLRPPPSEEDNTDLNTTLTPAATSGTNIQFTAGANVFLDGDKDRQIVYGTSRAVIVSITAPGNIVHADIIDAFPSTAAIPAGQWFLDKSPSSFLDPDKHFKLGAAITLDSETDSGSSQDTFRTADAPPTQTKYIKILGGLVETRSRPTVTQIKGIVRVALNSEKKDPDPAPGGDWTLEVPAWTALKGWPRTTFFYQGRLGHAGQPSGMWVLSASDDFENYGVGAHADSALQYTIVRQQASIVWCADLSKLLIATPESIFAAIAPGTNQPLGGDVTPLVRRQDAPGSLAVQPLVTGTTAIYIEANGKRVRELRYSPEQSTDAPYAAVDLTLLADHICGSGFVTEKIGWAESPNRHAYFVTTDGYLAALTYFNVPENVVGWSRIVTDGDYESICVIPHPDGNRDQVWCIVKRTITVGGVATTKRYIEYFEDNASELSTRRWKQLFTDCAIIYSGAAVKNVPNGFLNHLRGKTVDIVANGMYQGQRTVTAAGIFDSDLQEAHTLMEIGLHYESTAVTMKPHIDGSMIRTAKKAWKRVWLVLQDSIGGSVKGAGNEMQLLALTGGDPMDDGPPMFSGDKDVNLNGIDDEGRLSFYRRLPYPQTVLGVFGEVDVSEI